MVKRLLLALAVAGAVASPALGAAPGDPPTIDVPRCERFLRPCGDPLVLGETHDFKGRVEFVGMSSRVGPCVFIDTIKQGYGYGTCGAPLRPRRGEMASIYDVGFRTSRREYTQISGYLETDVDRLEVRYRRNGVPKVTGAGVADVDTELASRIGARAEFSVFELRVRGCIPLPRLRLVSLDASGAVLGRDRPNEFNVCRTNPSPPSARRVGRLAPGIEYGSKAPIWGTRNGG